MLCVTERTFADNPTPYQLSRQWLSGDGLPVDSPAALAFDGKGRLWIATHDGLAAFNGQTFRHFDTGTEPKLPYNRLMGVQAWGEGQLLVHAENTEFGLFCPDSGYHYIGRTRRPGLQATGDAVWFIEQGQLLRWTPDNGRETVVESNVRSITRSEDAVLLGMQDGRILSVNQHTLGVAQQAKASQYAVYALAASDTGDIAFVDSTQVGVIPAGAQQLDPNLGLRFDTTPSADSRITHTGQQWLISNVWHQGEAGSWLFDPEQATLEALPLIVFIPHRWHFRDAEGRLWMNLGDRLLRDGEVLLRTEEPIRDFLPDRYGQVWLAVLRGGLQRFSQPRIKVHGSDPEERAQLLSSYHLSQDGDSLLVGTFSGLERFSPGADRWQMLYDQLTVAGLRQSSGWLFGGKRLCDWRNEDSCDYDPAFLDPGTWISLLYEDSRQATWLGSNKGLHWRAAPQHDWQNLLPDVQAISLLEHDPERLWFGTQDHGIFEADLNQTPPRLSALLNHDNGLPSNNIRSLFQLSQQQVLIGTANHGLCLFESGRGITACASSEHGLPTHSVHCVLEDPHQQIWVNTNRGLWSAPRQKLLAFLNNPNEEFAFRHYSGADGLVSIEGNGGVHSSCTQTPDGSLWFANQIGVVQVPPFEPQAGAWPLHVDIHPFGHEHRATVQLPPDARTLRLGVEPVALRANASLQLRYRLDPTQQWGAVSALQDLTFGALAPGQYQLEVQARYSDSPWGESLTAIDISVPHRLSERKAFWAILATLAFALFSALLLRENARKRALETTVAQRTHSLQQALTAIQKQSKDLMAAAADKRQLFMTIGHELRTPLTLIYGPLQNTDHPPQPQQLARMRHAALQMRDLVEQILLLEGEQGSLQLSRQPERIEPLLRHTLNRMSATLADARMRWQLEIDDRLTDPSWRTAVDSRRMDLAFGTLIANACKYAGPDGHINVTARPADRPLHWEILIDDDGPGIAPDQRERLIKPFESGENAKRGLGLGLGLCQQIIKQHDGWMGIEDSPLGGARLRLQLPLLRETPGRAVSDNRRSGPIILVVDDHAGIRAHIRQLLEGQYRILEADNGEAGRQAAEQHCPDLIITDISMPVSSGLDMVRHLRAEESTAIIPVLFITAHANAENELAVFDAGGDQYLPKPFSDAQLQRRVGRMLSAREALILQARQDTQQEPQQASDGFRQQLDSAIQANLDDTELDVDRLAELLNTSRSSLYRKLNEHCGMKPAEYIRHRRLQRAAQLLRQTQYRVSEIAYAVGFKRLSNFTRSFRAEFELSPSAWRIRHQDSSADS